MKIKDCLSDFQKGNLETLSNYLLSGELQADFNMWKYSEYGNGYFPEEKTCGSVGCAVGHGPYAGIEVGQANDWTEYCNQKFVDTETLIWDYLFAEWWRNYDNTPQGAGKRIRFVLNNLEMEEEELHSLLPWADDYNL